MNVTITSFIINVTIKSTGAVSGRLAGPSNVGLESGAGMPVCCVKKAKT